MVASRLQRAADGMRMTTMSDGAIETTFRVGRRTVTLRVPCDARVAEIDADWRPSAPTRRLNKKDLKEYRRGILLLADALKAATGRGLVLGDSMYMRGVATPRECVTGTLDFVAALAKGTGTEGGR